MPLEVHALIFPRSAFTPADAAAWASLHGFDHARVDDGGLVGIVVEHRPRRLFDPQTLHRVMLEPEAGVGALVGKTIRPAPSASERLVYLETAEDRERYDRYSVELRRRALLGDTRVGPEAPCRLENVDLARWYTRWFMRTHEGAGPYELAVADAIRRGICQATCDHALDFVSKLGYARRI